VLGLVREKHSRYASLRDVVPGLRCFCSFSAVLNVVCVASNVAWAKGRDTWTSGSIAWVCIADLARWVLPVIGCGSAGVKLA